MWIEPTTGDIALMIPTHGLVKSSSFSKKEQINCTSMNHSKNSFNNKIKV